MLICSCKADTAAVPLHEGPWLGKLTVMDGHFLPFNFTIKGSGESTTMEIHNAEEVITVDELLMQEDSILIKFPVFDGYISGTFNYTLMNGHFLKDDLDRSVPFKAEYGILERFPEVAPSTANISGIWETEFQSEPGDSYVAKGIFTQQNNIVKGTFRTTTGDYRYLEGVVDGDSLKLSTFDGSHAFLFLGKVSDTLMTGSFYSGNHSKETFIAERNETFELPNPDSLTYLKDGYEKLDFSFPEDSGRMISLSDDYFKDKVTVVQLMGTWCPNCLDETKFLVDYANSHTNKDLAFVALSFEYAKTKEDAFKSITRLRERIGVPYPILLAQFGSSSKEIAQEKLPMLNQIISYPTTIFIDKKGAVRKIHTGFNGPATGAKYEQFKENFDTFITALLAE